MPPRIHLTTDARSALEHSRRRAELLSLDDSRARVALSRRTGGRGGMRRGGEGAPAAPLVRFVGGGGTFTRASEASYYTAPPSTTGGFLAWAASNTIREDKIDGVSGGYLFEPAKTNLCLYSEAIDNAAWTLSLSTIAGGSTTAPDGDVDCKTLQLQANAASKIYQANLAGTADATTYITSVWVRKPAGAGNVRITYLLRDATAPLTADKAVGTTWTRIEDARSWGTGATVPSIGIQNATAGTAQDVEVWGWQVESSVVSGGVRNLPSSHVRTTSAAVTRAADDLSFATTPITLLSGRYTFRFAPNYSTGESTTSSAYFTTGTTFNGIDSRTGISTLSAQLANVVKIAGPAITFTRNLVMTATIDLAAALITITGATTGSGTGAPGVAVSHTQAILYVGKFNTASTFYAGGRIWEPYAA